MPGTYATDLSHCAIAMPWASSGAWNCLGIPIVVRVCSLGTVGTDISGYGRAAGAKKECPFSLLK